MFRDVEDQRLAEVYGIAEIHHRREQTRYEPMTFYRMLCGTGRTFGTCAPCPGMLGNAYKYAQLGRLDHLRSIADAEYRFSRGYDLLHGWVLHHPDGLVWIEDGVYKPSAKADRKVDGAKVGRRPLPSYIMRDDVAYKTGGFSVIGQVPLLPATVICLRCQARNVIVDPDPEPDDT